MASGAESLFDSTNLKLRELLKEVQLDYSPENASVVDSVVSAIRDAIDGIPDGLPVKFWKTLFPPFHHFKMLRNATGASLNSLMLLIPV